MIDGASSLFYGIVAHGGDCGNKLLFCMSVKNERPPTHVASLSYAKKVDR